MTRFLLARAARMVLTVFAVVLITFGLTRVAYRNPARMLAPENASGRDHRGHCEQLAAQRSLVSATVVLRRAGT